MRLRNAEEGVELDAEAEELGPERAALLPAAQGELAQAEPAVRVPVVDAPALVRAE
jgi:hypothetical protein